MTQDIFKKAENMKIREKITINEKGKFFPIKVPLKISMAWTTAADFDLAAVYETQGGDLGFIYFNEFGDINNYPYIELLHDDGVNDTGGNNEETIIIQKLNSVKYVWIFCWDYNMVEKGQRARFATSDINFSLFYLEKDDMKEYSIDLDVNSEGNVCCIAVIDNSLPSVDPQLSKCNWTDTLKGLKTVGQLMRIVRKNESKVGIIRPQSESLWSRFGKILIRLMEKLISFILKQTN